MSDKFLTLFGTVFGGRALAYGRIDKARLPDHAKALLGHYKWMLVILCAAFVAPVFHPDLLTLLMFLPLAAITFVLKHKFEKQLDPLLDPYIPKDNAP